MNLDIVYDINLKSSTSSVRLNDVDLLGTWLIINLSFTVQISDSKLWGIVTSVFLS